MKDILDRIEDSSPNESSHELICRLRDCAHEIEALRAALAARPDAQADERGAMTKAWGEISASMYARMSPWEFYQAGWHASRAAAPQEAQGVPEAAAQAVCRTCNGNGMIGGPSYYAPDEGGEPCPDCCDTPSYCSSVRRCTAKDAEQPSERGEQDCPHGVDDGACGWCYDEKAASAPTLGESEWPSDRDAAIQACALMILGICKTRPQEVWPKEIEGRIRYMLLKLQPQAAEPKGLIEAIEALQCPETHSCSNPELFERGWEVGRGAALDVARAILAKGE